jgi:Xaa-Pro aminopeptidase
MAKIYQGMTGKAADAIARKVIEKAGYGEAFGHSLGHGVGFAEHEMPYLSPNSKEKLVDSMVFTIEPGIYLEGWGGVRIEDTVVMENGKVKMLTKARKQTC